MKKLLTALVLILAGAKLASPEPQVPAPKGAPSGVIALTTNSAIRLVPNPNTVQPFMCSSIFIQSVAGNSALVYVLNADPSITAVKDMDGTTTVAQLGIGSATSPGQSFTFPSNNSTTTQSGGSDLRYWLVQGSTGDSVLATCDLRR